MANQPASPVADELEALASARFPDLWSAERQLVRAVTTPDGLDLKDPRPWESEQADVDIPRWTHDRDVRSALIRWLCTNTTAKSLVDPRGIVLYNARIVGALNLNFTEIPFMLALRSCRIPRGLTLVGAQIKEVDVDGSWTGPLNFDRAIVANNIWLDAGLRAEGSVSLVATKIGGDLICVGSQFVNRKGNAFYADSITVAGSIHFRSWTNVGDSDALSVAPVVLGKASFFGARVGGDFDCSGAKFLNPGAEALNLSRIDVKGRLALMSWANAPLTVRGSINLSNASVGVLQDERAAWTQGNTVHLEGLAYGGFGPPNAQGKEKAEARLDTRERLNWLALDPDPGVQRYRQLAKVLQEGGDANGAVDVLETMEARLSARNDLVPKQLLKAAIGYGYRSENALWGLGAVTLVGWAVAWRHHRMGLMVPTDKDAAAEFRRTHATPSHYPSFQPLIFSLEKTFPLVTLGQADKWQPAPVPRRRWSRAVQWFIWAQIILGWLLATMFLGAVSGLIRHVQ